MFKNSGGAGVAAFATIFAIMISEGLSVEELSKLSSFFSNIGSSLQLISVIESGRLPVEESETTISVSDTGGQEERLL